MKRLCGGMSGINSNMGKVAQSRINGHSSPKKLHNRRGILLPWVAGIWPVRGRLQRPFGRNISAVVCKGNFALERTQTQVI